MNLFSCCFSTPSLSPECLQQVDKALGNIKNSHKAIAFIGVVQILGQKASLLQYQYNPQSGLSGNSPLKGSSSNLQASGQQQQQQSISQIKDKVEKILERTVSFKIAQRKIAREMGFDSSKEVFIKGEQSVIILYDLPMSSHHGGGAGGGAHDIGGQGGSSHTNNDMGQHTLVIFLEMNALKVEFFDCEMFITTIDDLVVSLIEALNYDNTLDSVQNDGGNQDDHHKRDRNH